MKENELVRDMYSRLNLIINELNSIGINKLGDADIVRKIISLLTQQRYGSIITILHNMEDLGTTIVIGKIAAFEMSRKMCRGEEPTSSRPYAFACDERKGKKKAPTPSSSSEEEEEEESDDGEDNQPSTSSSEDEETI
jgi:DNA replication protein DnaC